MKGQFYCFACNQKLEGNIKIISIHQNHDAQVTAENFFYGPTSGPSMLFHQRCFFEIAGEEYKEYFEKQIETFKSRLQAVADRLARAR